MMRLRKIATGKWSVVAEVDADGVCVVAEALDALSSVANTRGVAAGFRVQFERIPVEGPKQLPDELYHCIDANEGIYQFIKGRYRLVCFQASGRVVVCSALEMKKTKKAPRSWVSHAVALRDRYLAAERNRELVVEE